MIWNKHYIGVNPQGHFHFMRVKGRVSSWVFIDHLK